MIERRKVTLYIVLRREMEVGNLLGVIIVDFRLCFEFVNYFRWKKRINLYCFMEVETVLSYSMGCDY